LLGTTKSFLDHFGLRSIEEMPPLAELKAMADLNPQLDLPVSEEMVEANGVDAPVADAPVADEAVADEAVAEEPVIDAEQAVIVEPVAEDAETAR
jgi:segregation and condensation protein B